MIKYRLVCDDCKLIFDSWFASSKEYEKLQNKKLLTCHICNSRKVKKTLMAPKLIQKQNKLNENSNILKFSNIKKTIKNYQKFIKNNFKYVGENFAYEARSIHYDKKKNTKGIYGKVSKKDLKELKEEGIETQVVPWFEEKDN